MDRLSTFINNDAILLLLLQYFFNKFKISFFSASLFPLRFRFFNLFIAVILEASEISTEVAEESLSEEHLTQVSVL